MNNPAVMISDHAVIRYLERVAGLDVDGLRNKILPTGVAALIQGLGDGVYPIGDGYRVVVKNNTVLTVVKV